MQATYELVLGYDMQVPAMDMAAYRTLTADMEALQQAVEMVEARSEDLTEAFGRELAAGPAYCCARCGHVQPQMSPMHLLMKHVLEAHMRKAVLAFMAAWTCPAGVCWRVWTKTI